MSRGREPETVFTYDEMLDAVAIPAVPVAVTVLPAEIYRAPRSWGEQTCGNIMHWNEVDEGGHFAAREQPRLLTDEIRAALRPLR